MAEILSITQGAIHNSEKGYSETSIDILIKITFICNATVDKLIEF